MPKSDEQRYAEAVRRKMRAGLGSGRGASYKPWLTVRSFGSKSSTYRAYGKIGRTHHLLSGGELTCFALLNMSSLTVDIREQFPLFPLKETQGIALELGVRHPRARCARRQGAAEVDIIMTTDFLVDLVDDPTLPAHVAVSVKDARDLDENTPRKLANLLNKAEIERRYWAKRRIPFVIFTEADVSCILVKNVRLLQKYIDPVSTGLSNSLLDLANYLFDRFQLAIGLSVQSHCQEFDKVMGLPSGTGVSIVWHCIASGAWRVDLNEPLDSSMLLCGLHRGSAMNEARR